MTPGGGVKPGWMLEVVVDIVSDLKRKEISVACVSETETQFKIESD